MAQQYFVEWTVWFLVVTTLGAGCGDGESVAEPDFGECARQGSSTPSLASPCGDGVVQAGCGEECDDGNLRTYDACLPNCELARCGDGILRTEYPDGCDPPNDDESCPRFEACDDGNDEGGDGCSGTCQIEE
jgi:cysteine-rich repeat protein